MTKPLRLLLNELASADVATKVEAAKAFSARRKHPATTTALCHLLRGAGDEETRYWAAYALLSTHDARGAECLIAAVADTDEAPRVRGQAAEALGVIALSARRGGVATTPLIEALRDPEPEVRFWAAYALGQIRDRAALPALELVAASDDAVVPGWWSVRKEAADAIAYILHGPEGNPSEAASTATNG